MNAFAPLLLVFAFASMFVAFADEQECTNCKRNFDTFRPNIRTICPNVDQLYVGLKALCAQNICPDDAHIRHTAQYLCDSIAQSGDFDECVACSKPGNMNFCEKC